MAATRRTPRRRVHASAGPARAPVAAGTAGPPGGVVIGTIVAIADGAPLVQFAGAPGPVPARAAARLGPAQCGMSAVIAFEGGSLERPIVLGVLSPHGTLPPTALEGDTVTLRAERQIVLRCGNASITLTSAGKVLIKGEYVLSRSSGANQVKGASVQIN